jgi:hypothetical protein
MVLVIVRILMSKSEFKDKVLINLIVGVVKHVTIDVCITCPIPVAAARTPLPLFAAQTPGRAAEIARKGKETK